MTAHIFRTLLSTLVLACVLTPPAAGDPGYEQYFVVLLGEERAGWMKESITHSNGLITTAALMRFEVGRGAATVKIDISTEFVEREDHTPVSMSSRQSIAAIPVETRYEFDGDTVRVTSTQQGRTSTREADAPTKPWVTPAMASELVKQAIDVGEPIPDLTTLDPAFGLTPITTSRSDPEITTVEVFGRVVPAYRTMSSLSTMPGAPSEEFIGMNGRLVRSTTKMGGLAITMLEAEPDLALAEIDPPEIMRSTFIEPNREIRNPRETRRASYILSVPDATLGDIPSWGRHTVEVIDDRTARLTLDLDAAPDRSVKPDTASSGPSTMLDSEDEAITALVGRARPKADAPPAVRAEALRRFVHSYIDSKSLDVGFATASEVARSRVGDCTEHAVLLAAMLRADGIPSRTVSGLVYATDFAGSQDIFGYHMWTQAWLPAEDGEPGWIDLDATMGSSTPFDATHIALEVSTMTNGGTINSMLALAPLMGRLQVTIESIEP